MAIGDYLATYHHPGGPKLGTEACLEVRCRTASANPTHYSSISIHEVMRYRMCMFGAMPYDPLECDKRATRRATSVVE
jgi:hypothetical protein